MNELIPQDVNVDLPPWEVDGQLIDIDVNQKTKTFTVLVSLDCILNPLSLAPTDNFINHCLTVKNRLLETCPPDWKVR